MAGRRGNNEGSITQRPDGRWEARITLHNNKRKSFYGKTRQEVARKLTEALRDRDKGLPIVGDKQTVEQFATMWLSGIHATLGPTTVLKYEREVRLRFNPAFGRMVLSKLSAQHIQMLYSSWLEKGLSGTSVHHTHAVLHKMLTDALRLGLVQRNVCDLVDPPRMNDHEMSVYSPEEARRFLNSVRGHRLEALYVLALSTGMRQGELLALKWRDVDIDNGVVQVRANLKYVKGQYIIAETKTKRSRRKIRLTPLACEALRRHRAKQIEERLSLGPAWEDNDLVFPNALGKPFLASSFNRVHFLPLVRKAGLPRIRFHDLRHTAATLLLLQGVHVKVVSEMLGHASVSITLDRYSHVLPDMQHDAMQAMQKVLGS